MSLSSPQIATISSRVGVGFAITVKLFIAVHPLLSVTVSEYEPWLEILIYFVMSPVVHWYTGKLFIDVNVASSP